MCTSWYGPCRCGATCPASGCFRHANTDITVDLPVTTLTVLPIYLADKEGLFKKHGLNVKLVTFHGGTDLVRGMIAGAVDVGVTALAGVSLGIAAGQPIKAFYGGFNMGVFEWYATKDIKTIKETKGKRFGVTRVRLVDRFSYPLCSEFAWYRPEEGRKDRAGRRIGGAACRHAVRSA